MTHTPKKLFLVLLAVLLGAVAATRGRAVIMSPQGFGSPGKLPSPGQGGAALGPLRWRVNSGKSLVRFMAVKDGGTPVKGLVDVTGGLDLKNNARLDLNLRSVNTGNPDRDKNLTDVFFETAKAGFDTASVSLPVDPSHLSRIKLGESFSANLTGSLTLHGAKVEVPATVFFSPLRGQGVRVMTAQPIELGIESLKMGPNLEALIKKCGHQSVDKTVFVTFDLTFN